MARSSADIINLADVKSNPLRATNLKADLTDAVSSIVLLQIYAMQAAQQPELDPLAIGADGKDLLPLLTSHQQTARRNAQEILATIVPNTITVLTDILGFGAMLDAFTNAILPLLPSITTNDNARQQVLSLIGQLEIAAAARDSNARQLATALNQMVAKTQVDSTNFAADVDQANKVIGSDSGALAQIQSQIDDTRRAIDGEIAGVVISSLVVVGGAIIIGVGALATLPANVSAASVILPGIGVVVTGITGLTAAATALGKDNSKLAGLYQQSAWLNATLTLVRALAGHITSFANAASGMVSAIGGLTSEWASLQTGIASFRNDVVRAGDESDIVHITTALQLAQQDWKMVVNQAQQLTSRLVDISPREVADVLKMAA